MGLVDYLPSVKGTYTDKGKIPALPEGPLYKINADLN